MINAYSYLDQSEFRALYCGSKSSRQIKFFVEGIRCAKCVNKIEDLRDKISHVRSLEVDLADQTVALELVSEQDSFAEVAQAISNLGYRAIPVRFDEDSTQHWKKESRQDLVRLAIAGFCAGNIMMLAFAGYFGDLQELKRPFEWFQLALYLPVVSFVALPFYQGFWNGIKNRSLSIDGPMAIASLLGFLVSATNLIRGSGSIYFDSLSGFLFLILATRYWQKRSRFEYLKYLRPSVLAETLKARRQNGDGWQWMPSGALNPGDSILVQKNEWIPVDGVLIDDQAVLDLSILNGESHPRRVQKDFVVQAGSKLLTEQALIRVRQSGAKTLLSHLLSTVQQETVSETQGARVSDVAAQILLWVVLAMACGLLLSGLQGDFHQHFEKALALIILACPCAMAFGTPLAYAFAMKRAQDGSVFLKSARTLDRLRDVQQVFLDKTGTVTEKNWQIHHSSLESPTSEFQKIILRLEAQSQHPIAFALRELWSDITPDSSQSLQSWQEKSGRGVEGKINGQLWKFQSFQEGSEKYFGLWQDSQLVWKFQLSPVLQVGAADSVQKLRTLGLDVFLVSGDSRTECLRMARELKIPEDQVYSGMSPQDKLYLVQAHPRGLMVGDGVNDALALKNAHVGIAVKGGVDLALRAADGLILNDGLSALTELFHLAKLSHRQIRRNLLAALIYNSLGATLAFGGYVNPFVAALLMPASSMFIWGSTWWGMRR
jgi:Cu2+-exporting ATPase/Cu+-exporting ATPase